MIRLAVRVRRDDAEVALAELLELAPGGVEEKDLGQTVEYAIYGAPGELPALPDLQAAAGGALVEVSTSEVADDWEQRWQGFHRPVLVGPPGRCLHVRPPWRSPRREPGVADIVIDPGQAFGTGAHATTRLCLELMLELRPGGALVDVGSGSGVLAIAAAKLGWAPVLALDHEDEAVQATAANAAANDVQVQVRQFDLLHDGRAPGAPTVVANLLAPLLLRLADDGLSGSPPRALVAGGLLAYEVDAVSGALASGFGLRETARRREGEWAAALLTVARGWRRAGVTCRADERG
jgi:ribosomal protein L11 methyltransferase